MYKSAYFIVHRNTVTDMVMLSEQHYAVLEKQMITILSDVISRNARYIIPISAFMGARCVRIKRNGGE